MAQVLPGAWQEETNVGTSPGRSHGRPGKERIVPPNEGTEAEYVPPAVAAEREGELLAEDVVDLELELVLHRAEVERLAEDVEEARGEQR